LEELADVAAHINEDKVIRVVQWLVDNKSIGIDKEKNYFWDSKDKD
jgi:hypothetical protein